MDDVEVTLYTKPGCHLCDLAKKEMFSAAEANGFRIALREVNIESDPDAFAKYRNDIPVIFMDGKEAFRHRVERDAFVRAAREAAVTKEPGDGTGADLAARECVPCRGGVPALQADEIRKLLDRLGGGWAVVNEHHLAKELRVPDFRQALEVTNRIGELAEELGHHPDILVGWGKVGITIWTHAIDGLTESDFVLAAKIDRLMGR